MGSRISDDRTVLDSIAETIERAATTLGNNPDECERLGIPRWINTEDRGLLSTDDTGYMEGAARFICDAHPQFEIRWRVERLVGLPSRIKVESIRRRSDG